MSSKLYCKWFIFSSRALLKVLNDNEQKTDPGNTVLETFLLRLSCPLNCLIHLEAPLQGLGTSLEKLRSKQMDGDSVQNVPLTFGDLSDPSSTCCVNFSWCCFIAADVCRWQRCCLGSELGELGTFSLWGEISPPMDSSSLRKETKIRMWDWESSQLFVHCTESVLLERQDTEYIPLGSVHTTCPRWGLGVKTVYLI